MRIPNKSAYLRRQKLDLLVLSEEEAIQNRIQEMAHRFRLAKKYFPTVDSYVAESAFFNKIPIALFTRPEDLDVLVKTTPTTFLVFITKKDLTAAEVHDLKIRGVSAVLSEKEFLETIKFDYLCLYKIRAAYFPISLQDIFPMSTMTFNASIRLPLNQKFLAVIFKNFTLSEEKYKKIEAEGRLFIRNRDTADYLRYILTYNDGLGAGLKKRCRGLFLCLSAQFLSLQELLMVGQHADETETIQAAYKSLEDLCTEIVGYIHNAGDVDLWDVFREALVNEIFDYFRAPWIAVYAALVAEKSQRGNPVSIMMAALLGELALTDVSRDMFLQYAEPHQDPTGLSEKEWREFPARSVAMGNEKKLPWSDEIQKIIQTWQPQNLPAANVSDVPVDAWILQFADVIDRGVRTFMEENKVTFQYLRKTLWEQKSKSDSGFPPDVIAAFAPVVD
jgi:hypothetical protein